MSFKGLPDLGHCSKRKRTSDPAKNSNQKSRLMRGLALQNLKSPFAMWGCPYALTESPLSNYKKLAQYPQPQILNTLTAGP